MRPTISALIVLTASSSVMLTDSFVVEPQAAFLPASRSSTGGGVASRSSPSTGVYNSARRDDTSAPAVDLSTASSPVVPTTIEDDNDFVKQDAVAPRTGFFSRARGAVTGIFKRRGREQEQEEDVAAGSSLAVMESVAVTETSAEVIESTVVTETPATAEAAAEEISVSKAVAVMDVEKDMQQDEGEEMSQTEKLLKQVKDAGVAGVVSYALWELAFWFVSIPVVMFGYFQVVGHWPDFSNKEDVATVSAEAFAFVNFARFAVPLRIGLALSTTPWIQENVVDRFASGDDKEEEEQANKKDD